MFFKIADYSKTVKGWKQYFFLYLLKIVNGQSDGQYGLFLKVGQAGVMYMLTQLAKMMFLATFFPMPEMEEDEVRRRHSILNVIVADCYFNKGLML